MRGAGRLKLGYFPLPTEEAHYIRRLLVPSPPYAAIGPCVGDGAALLEITSSSCLAGIELDADRTVNRICKSARAKMTPTPNVDRLFAGC